jgi:hypothetical protein
MLKEKPKFEELKGNNYLKTLKLSSSNFSMYSLTNTT